jgi:hypothetical protein
MNIYFKVVEVQIQALEYIPKLGRDTSHPIQLVIIMMCQFLSLCMFADLNVLKVVVRSSSGVDDDSGDRWCG